MIEHTVLLGVHALSSIVTACVRSTTVGYVFTGVCLSMGGGGDPGPWSFPVPVRSVAGGGVPQSGL